MKKLLLLVAVVMLSGCAEIIAHAKVRFQRVTIKLPHIKLSLLLSTGLLKDVGTAERVQDTTTNTLLLS